MVTMGSSNCLSGEMERPSLRMPPSITLHPYPCVPALLSVLTCKVDVAFLLQACEGLGSFLSLAVSRRFIRGGSPILKLVSLWRTLWQSSWWDCVGVFDWGEGSNPHLTNFEEMKWENMKQLQNQLWFGLICLWKHGIALGTYFWHDLSKLTPLYAQFPSW